MYESRLSDGPCAGRWEKMKINLMYGGRTRDAMPIILAAACYASCIGLVSDLDVAENLDEPRGQLSLFMPL